MPWWNCAVDFYPAELHDFFGVKGCVLEANGCSRSLFKGVEWSEIQEGRMFWLLLAPSETDPDMYTLTTSMEIMYWDASASQNVTLVDQFKTELDEAALVELQIAPPTMDIRVTNYEIGAVNSENKALIRLEMELYLSDEDTR